MFNKQLSAKKVVFLLRNQVRFESSYRNTATVADNTESSSSKYIQNDRNDNSRTPRAPFKGYNNSSNGERRKVNFDKNMPYNTKPKAWERDHESKESWFKRKHAHHHAQQKPYRRQTERRYEGIERMKREERREEFDRRDKLQKHWGSLRELRSNPLVDYIFGTNAVLAALKSNQRESMGKLYIHNAKDTSKVNEILKLAKEHKIPISEMPKQDLNQLTDNAVHNGIVLETRPIEVESIKALGPKFDETSYSIKSANELLHSDAINEEVITDSYGKRFPFGLYLDEITDPHNIGAILRSAYFLGVDFVVFSERNCSSLTPVVCKTSSGALEFTKIYKVNKPLAFFEASKANGWKLISAVSPTHTRDKAKQVSAETINEMLETEPVLLVVGSEGLGIRTNIIDKSDNLVSVSNGRELNECVDSLNVSVATALLITKILNV